MKHAKILILMTAVILSLPAAYGGGVQDTSRPVSERGIPETIPRIDPVTLDQGEKLKVTATTSIIGDVLQQVAGDLADVSVLIGPGINPHNFSAAPSDLRVVERADIIFINGLDLEENVLDDIAATAAGYIVPVSDGIRIIGADDEADEHAHDDDEHDADAHDDDEHEDDADEHAHEHADGDPHVWMDPASAAVWVRNMIQVLSSADPANTYAYQRNGNAYLEQLNELDTEIRAMISVIPLEKRKLVLDHQAFTYFAEAYDFEVTGAIIPGTTSNAEPSARDIAALSRLLKEEQVKAIFVGETASSNLKKLAETLTKEIGGNQEVRIMATLTGALALEGERGDTYLDLIRYNAEQVVNGLRE